MLQYELQQNYINIMRRKVFIAGLFFMIILFVIYPDIVSNGAEKGLMLWFRIIIPSLMPFMVVSSLFVKLHVTGYISRIFYPVFHHIFGLSEEGCYPAVVGMLSGYPLGAATAGDMYKQKIISRSEAQYILGFCNNASPMFMIEYIGVKCLKLNKPVVMLMIIYASAVINAWISGYKGDKSLKGVNNKHTGKNYSVMEAIDESIINSAVVLVKVGGYIILFSIITSFVQYLPIPTMIKIVGYGILEITTGSEVISSSGIVPLIRKSVIAGICAFGGLSSVAQTSGVLIGTDLSVRKYLIQKIRQGIIAFMLSLIIFSFISDI